MRRAPFTFILLTILVLLLMYFASSSGMALGVSMTLGLPCMVIFILPVLVVFGVIEWWGRK